MVADPSAFGDRVLEVKKEIAEKAAQDSDWRAALMANPNSTIEEEYGLESGTLSDLDMRIVEESAGSVVIPIPPELSEMELTDEQLDQVAGGAAFTGVVIAGLGAAATAATVAQGTRAGRRW